MNPVTSAFLSRWLIDRQGGHRQAVLREFQVKQRSSAPSGQDARLAALLNHALENVPFYRRAMDALAPTVTPDAAREVLARFPVLTRAQVQERGAELRAANIVDVVPDATGGSTGTPMTFQVDRATQVARESSLMWADSLAGWKYGERIAMLWGAHRDTKIAVAGPRLALRWWIDNRRWYNAFDMDEERMETFHREMSRFQPHLLVAYAGSVFEFARFLRDRNLPPSYPLKAVVSSAEMLTPEMRSLVEQVFRKPVFDRYGNREFGAIAAECGAHRGLHVNEADCLVEVLSRDPLREAGPIVVTYLRNYAMPFIRYDTGDWGRFEPSEPCPCGLRAARLAPVTGRVSDTIRTRSGKLIHGEFFTHLLYGADGVRQFQFVQETQDDYRLLLVADRGEVADREPEWRKDVLAAVGSESRLIIEYVADIPLLPSGKRRFTLTKLRTEPRLR